VLFSGSFTTFPPAIVVNQVREATEDVVLDVPKAMANEMGRKIVLKKGTLAVVDTTGIM